MNNKRAIHTNLKPDDYEFIEKKAKQWNCHRSDVISYLIKCYNDNIKDIDEQVMIECLKDTINEYKYHSNKILRNHKKQNLDSIDNNKINPPLKYIKVDR